MAEHKLQALIKGLSPWFFNKKTNNTIQGHTYANAANTLDIGSPTVPFRNIYADNLVATSGILDQFVAVDSSDATPSYLDDKLVADAPLTKTITSSVMHLGISTTGFLLQDGTRALQGNLAVDAGITIDGVDLGTVGNGLQITSNHYAVQLATNPGLQFSTGLKLLLDSPSGLGLGAGGLSIADTIAGNGLGISGKVLSVNVSNGLEINTDNVRVDQAYSFLWTASHQFNAVTNFHSNVNFKSADRTITSDSGVDVTWDLGTSNDAKLFLATNQEFRSFDFSDGIPIAGFSLFVNTATPPNRQLTINTIKSDELHTRLFIADGVRIDIGEEYWGKSMGILHNDFTVPSSYGGTVSIYFEDSPVFNSGSSVGGNPKNGTGSAALFQSGDYILFRYIDWGTGLDYGSVWGQVTSYFDMGNDTPDGKGYQRWTFTVRAGDLSVLIKKGNVGVDFGSTGQGYVHLSTLQDASGPWIRIGTWTTNPYTPGNNQTKTQIGNLTGITDTVLDPAGYGIYSDNAYFHGIMRTAETIIDDSGFALQLMDVDGSIITDLSQLSRITWWVDLADRISTPLSPQAEIAAWIDSAGLTEIGTFNRFVIDNKSSGYDAAIIKFTAGSGASVTIDSRSTIYLTATTIDSRTIKPSSDLGFDLGSASRRWGTIYADNIIISTSISGSTIGGSTWTNPSSMIIDATGSGTRTVSITNSGAGSANLDVDQNITLGGTVDGVDIAAHAANPDAHHDHATAGNGISITSQVISLASSVAGDGLTFTTGVLDVVALSTGGLTANANSLQIKLPVTSGLVTDSTGLYIDLASNSGLTITGGLAVASSIAGAGLVLTSGVLDVVALSTGGLLANANNIQIKLPSPSGLIIDVTGLYIGDGIAGDGLSITAKVLAVDASVVRTNRAITAGNGLTGGGDLSANRTLDVGAGSGISVAADSVSVNLATTSGLNLTSGLALDDSVAGAGLIIASKILAVGAGAGIAVAADAVAISLGTNSALNTASGLVVDTSIAGAGLTMTSGVVNVIALSTGGMTINADSIQIKLPVPSGLITDSTGLYIDDLIAGSGLGITSKVLSVNVSNGLEINTDNVRVNQAFGFSWTGNSTWAGTSGFNGNVTLSANGTFSTGVFTFNTTPQINADLNFTKGSATSITTAQALTISPTGDLTLDPSGIIILPNAQEMKTTTFTDAVTGIVGMRFWDRGSNYRQLTIGAMKMDELYARVFVADATRIDLGAQTWSKSFGVVETDFVLPAVNSTVDVWFEDIRGLGSTQIFVVGDYLMCRMIDWTSSLTVVKIWFRVEDGDGLGTNDYVSIDSTNYRQQWRLTRISGGTTSMTIKKGSAFIDAGTTGQGVVELSALKQDGGPYIQMGAMTSISTNPVFTYYTRMGNLNGTVDYVADTQGFATGKNLGTSVSGGFSGATVDSTNGLRLFNTQFFLYSGGTKIGSFGEDTGVVYAYDTATFTSPSRGMYWTSGSLPTLTNVTALSAYRDVNGNHASFSTRNAGLVDVTVEAYNSSTGYQSRLDLSGTFAILGFDDFNTLGNPFTGVRVETNGRTQIGYTGLGGASATASRLHVWENTTANDATTGLTIENANSSGDAVLQFVGTSGTAQSWEMGIDRSNSNLLTIGETAGFGSNVRLTITPTTGLLNVFSGFAKATASTNDVAAFGTSDAPASQLQLVIRATGNGTAASRAMVIQSTEVGTAVRSLGLNPGGGTVGVGITLAASTLHVFDNNSNTGASSGLTIGQSGSGDAVAQFILTGGQRWVMGIDNSDSDKFKISSAVNLGSSDVFTIATDGTVSFGTSGILTPLASGVAKLIIGDSTAIYTANPGAITTAQTWTIDITLPNAGNQFAAVADITINQASTGTSTMYLGYKASVFFSRTTVGATATIRGINESHNIAGLITLTGPTAIANGIRYVLSSATSTMNRGGATIIIQQVSANSAATVSVTSTVA